MTSAVSLAVLVASFALGGVRPSLVRAGGDPSRGLLVNRTWGARPFDPPDLGRPTVVFIHGFNPTPRLVHFDMAQQLGRAVACRGDEARGCNVLAWEWNAATFVGLRPAANSEAAVEQGVRLAETLIANRLDPTRTHLIGHSAGGMVAASAASTLAHRWARPVAHLTLLEPATFYHPVIFERLAAGSLAHRVENYWAPGPSAFGRAVPLPGIRNYRVPGPNQLAGLVLPLRSDHLYVVSWYLATAADPTRVDGFNQSALIRGG